MLHASRLGFCHWRPNRRNEKKAANFLAFVKLAALIVLQK